MHFYYLVALKVVRPNACVQNYQNKNSIISYVRLSLLSPLSSDTQPYTKFLKLKRTNKNTQNVSYKIKSYFPWSVQGAKACQFVVLLQKILRKLLCIAKTRT